MGQSLNKTKHRINSIKNTQKITKAMEMISSVKLKRIKNKYDDTHNFLSSLLSLVATLNKEQDTNDEGDLYMFKENNEVEKNLYVVINSCLGLCGSFNNEIIKKVEQEANANDEILCVGSKGVIRYKEKFEFVNDTYQNVSDKFNLSDVDGILKIISRGYKDKVYGKVFIIYTNYVNSIKFIPTIKQIMPLVKENFVVENESKFFNGITIFEPNKKVIFEETISLYLSTLILDCLYSSLVSEFANRRLAMENANDNADDLLNKLNLEYNKARQSQITNEIIEVISGSNALNKLGG